MPGPNIPSSAGDARRAGEASAPADIREFVADALRQAGTAPLLVISVPAPVIQPSQLLPALPVPDAVCWQPPDGASLAGIGTTRELAVKGTNRCESLALAAEHLFSELKVCPYPGFAAPSPRLLGGLAFAADVDTGPSSERQARATPWQGFGDGGFVLPRWCYQVEGERACLSLAVAATAAGRQSALIELDTLWRAFDRPSAHGEPEASPTERPRLDHLDPKIWNQRVKQIRELIAAGEFEKVVTARTTTVTSERPLDELGMMDRLASLYPRCTRFLFRRVAPPEGGRGNGSSAAGQHNTVAFIGATPETLFAKRGTEILTHALAGSVKVHPDLTAEEAGAALFRSGKNRAEHEVVARQVLAALEPLVEAVEHAAEPRVMQLQNLLHLETPIRARLRSGEGVAALLAALHPTPAVAGLPRAAAMHWIAANEESRGWYTGPVGWLDAAGDGEFAVAIRCALLERRRAHVFAGAGIMHDSDPPMEYAETAVKLQAMLRALGVET